VWRTSLGDRVLRGAEWELFRTALCCVWDLVEESFVVGDLFESGIDAFDDLQPGQQLALLALVGQALRDEATPTPPLTAHNEAAIATAFESVRQSIELEADDEGEAGTFWRGLVRMAYGRTEAGRGEPLPAATCDDHKEWDLLIESLSDRILWDADYEMGGELLDADPEEARARLKALRIDEDYYLALAPDPVGEELGRVRRTLRQLTGRPEPEEPELLPGLEDTYHGLLVGPCPSEAVDAETACRLVSEVDVFGPEGFDCSYGEWAELLRGEVLRAAREPPPPSDPASVLTPGQRGGARRAQRARAALEAGEGHRVEPRGAGWVVVDGKGWFLAEADSCTWSDHEDDPDLPPLAFPTAEEALAAFVRSDALAHARAGRRKEALKRLGRG
jgi:hypothetical protein